MRKVIHIDMDAFYASVEQRDRPDLRGQPVIVAWRGPRSVVCAASYEARKYGVRSAMPAGQAERLCPQAVFLPPDFSRYRAASQAIRNIFLRHTVLVEPLSLDEAYLDVTENRLQLSTATAVAKTIRAEIEAETRLTASAGVAPNKFLAKIASDWRKPNGLFVIQPHEALDFLAPLPVGRVHGVGRATEAQLKRLGITTIGELRGLERQALEARFGRFGQRLYDLARGIDPSPVCPNRPVQSVSTEQTFEQDLLLSELEQAVQTAAERTWHAAAKLERVARTVILKLKTSDFKTITRSLTPMQAPACASDLVAAAATLLARVDLPPGTRYRLAGVGLANFVTPPADGTQPQLFAETPIAIRLDT